MFEPDRRLARLRRDLADVGGRLYVGRAQGGLVFTQPQQALLVVGPPRSGKSTGLLVPNILAAPGAVVATSTKTDLVEATAGVRGGLGRCWAFDPSGTARPPEGCTPLRWSPVAAAGSWDGAVLVARVMVDAALPPRTGMEAHWTERAQALLAPLLHAAALEGGDMRLVLRWVLRTDAGPAGRVLDRTGGSLAGDVLAGVVATDPRERSGIWSTAAGVLAAYRSEAALDAATPGPFDPALLPDSGDTVYLCAPGHLQHLAAPIVVAFLETVRAATYLRRPTVPLTVVLDEAANIAPLPGLPAMVSEGGSQGLSTVACLQDLSQARQRWGPAADGFLTLFGAKVVLPGVADLATLQLLSHLGGHHDVPTRSVSTTPWWSAAGRSRTVTWSTDHRPRLAFDAVNQLPPGRALLLEGSRAPTLVSVGPWWATAPFAPRTPDAPASVPPRRPTRPGARTGRLRGSGRGGVDDHALPGP